MRILVAAATTNEIGPFLKWLETLQLPDVEVLITGIGSTASAYRLTRQLMASRPDIVIQAGICGSYNHHYPPGSLAFVGEEVIADLGALENGSLTDMFDMGFIGSDEKPFTCRMLVNRWQQDYRDLGLNFVRGATVNAISATPQQVDQINKKYSPVLESMEGAALHFVCLMENIRFLQLRAVSNFAGERDKTKWNIPGAVRTLNEKLISLVREFSITPQTI